MVTAYVIVKIEPGKEGEVTQNLVKINEIAEGALTYGFCDIMLKVNVGSIEELRVVTDRVRKISGIKETQTIIVSEYLL